MSKNLIIRISNGFGNQMFLYAAAYAFSKKLGYNLLIDDKTGIEQDLRKWKKKKRINWAPKYELGIFKLKSNFRIEILFLIRKIPKQQNSKIFALII